VRSTEFDYNDLNYKKPFTIEEELNHKGSTRFASFIQKLLNLDTCITKVRNCRTRRCQVSKLPQKSLPPLEFEYSQATIQEKIEKIDAVSLKISLMVLMAHDTNGLILMRRSFRYYDRTGGGMVLQAKPRRRKIRSDGDGCTNHRFLPLTQTVRTP